MVWMVTYSGEGFTSLRRGSMGKGGKGRAKSDIGSRGLPPERRKLFSFSKLLEFFYLQPGKFQASSPRLPRWCK